jgi:hypothetical protein
MGFLPLLGPVEFGVCRAVAVTVVITAIIGIP